MIIKTYAAGSSFSRNCINSFWMVEGCNQLSLEQINEDTFKERVSIPTKEKDGKNAIVYHLDMEFEELRKAGYELIGVFEI